MEWTQGDYVLTDDQATMPLHFIAGALQTTYWAAERPKEVIEKALENSVLLSMFYRKRPVGFLRIVTDYATYAWICDVFILPEFRGQGLGKWMFECAEDHPATQVLLQTLCTKDAHGLYEQFGFTRRECMFKRRKITYEEA